MIFSFVAGTPRWPIIPTIAATWLMVIFMTIVVIYLSEHINWERFLESVRRQYNEQIWLMSVDPSFRWKGVLLSFLGWSQLVVVATGIILGEVVPIIFGLAAIFVLDFIFRKYYRSCINSALAQSNQ